MIFRGVFKESEDLLIDASLWAMSSGERMWSTWSISMALLGMDGEAAD